MCHAGELLIVLACLLSSGAHVAAFRTEPAWVDARATFYGRDRWSLHTGSCGFGFICPDRWAGELAEGLDVVAVPDRSDLNGHCGECLEVRCRSAEIPVDGVWNALDRRGLCLNDKAVKVKITDTCPCVYPANAASNARWCCGDYPHLDMSQFALEKIAQDTDRWGVFAVSYRKVDCALQIPADEEAPPLPNAKPDPHYSAKPAGVSCAAVAASAQKSSSKVTASRQAQKKTAAKERASGYWQSWWSRFRNMGYAAKNQVYRKIWADIKSGKLDKDGHGKHTNRKQ